MVKGNSKFHLLPSNDDLFQIISNVDMTVNVKGEKVKVSVGDVGGKVSSINCLSANDSSWIFDGSIVRNSRVERGAVVYGNSKILSGSIIDGNVSVIDSTIVDSNISTLGNNLLLVSGSEIMCSIISSHHASFIKNANVKFSSIHPCMSIGIDGKSSGVNISKTIKIDGDLVVSSGDVNIVRCVSSGFLEIFAPSEIVSSRLKNVRTGNAAMYGCDIGFETPDSEFVESLKNLSIGDKFFVYELGAKSHG